MTDSNKPLSFDTFDEAWEHLNQMGMPVIHLSEEDYKMIMEQIGNAESMREVDKIFDRLKA